MSALSPGVTTRTIAIASRSRFDRTSPTASTRAHIQHLRRRRWNAAHRRAAAVAPRSLARRASRGRRGHARHPLGAHAPRPGASVSPGAADGRSQGALKRRPGSLVASRLLSKEAKVSRHQGCLARVVERRLLRPGDARVRPSSSASSPPTVSTSLSFLFLGRAMPTLFLAFSKPCARFAGRSSAKRTKSLHIVQRTNALPRSGSTRRTMIVGCANVRRHSLERRGLASALQSCTEC